MARREPYIDIRLGNDKYQRINDQYQYDRGMKLRLYGLTQRDVFTVHFSYAGIQEAVKTMPHWEGEYWMAEIPDVMLLQNKELLCYVYFEESSGGVTGYEISLPIIPRTKPSDYVLDPANVFVGVGELIEKAQAAEILDNSAEVVQAAHDAEDALAEVVRLEATTQTAAQTVEDGLAEIDQKRRQIAAIKSEADTLAAQALEKATNAENESAETATSVDSINRKMEELAMRLETKFDNAFLESGLLYFEGNNVVLCGPLGPFAGGGGGGGGGTDTGNNAVITVTNTSGWMSKTIAKGSNCIATLNWSSLEDNIPTGDGTLSVIISGSVRAMVNVAQGDVSIDLSKYAGVGSSVIKINIADTYGNSRTINFSVTVVELSISSSFDSSVPYSGPIVFPYTPMGNVSKTVYFILDEGTARETIGTATTSVSNRQQSYTILQQPHGAHTLRCYFESEINGQTVRSNELYFEIICIDPLSSEPIITSNFKTSEVSQYTPIHIDYTVYDPLSMVSNVVIAVNNEVVSTLTDVDRTSHVFDYRPVEVGTLVITIASGEEVRAFTINVTESEIQVEAEKESLALYLTSSGRSNDEAASERAQWNYESIKSTMSNFNWTSNGWQHDDEGTPVLRVSGDARVTIPYKIFGADFRGTGKTVEIEFATSTVVDYDAVILSCFSGDRGLTITPQKATIKSEQSEISMQYKENEHVRLSFVVEKRSENRLIYCYVNGIMSAVVQYPNDDDFAQANPVDITIGSNDCAIDIYCIRVYDNDLNRGQILDNWIADTQILEDMIARYNRNNVYDEYGNIVISKLPGDLPYMIHEAEQLPQYKGDKKTIKVEYTDPIHAEKSFTATGVQSNVQGTSSAPYARKNYDNQYKEGFETSYGHIDNYALTASVVPFNRFVLKADVASSEGANNVELVKLYCDISPYKTREMIADSKVRQGIYGFPIVLFWRDPDSGNVQFMGKYNFNLPKRAPEPYGYSGNMESWEFQNNTSDLMVFKSDYFDETMYTDPDTGDTKELWRYDYEARFPSDEWVDYTKLQELQSFICSTDRAKATGQALSAPVTYGGVEYTKDTADYRLAKFKAEFGNYAEVQSFIFYYIFTEFFLMVDSRAKNLFIGFSGSDTDSSLNLAIDRKAVAEPYDMDTAIGTNNEGSLVFGYSLEDTDHLAGGANVFNGQDSVLWCNVRDAFSNEIRQMYQTLRSNGTLSYAEVEKRFEDHQAKWPEAVWNEDAYFKYIAPLIEPDPGKEATAVYLPMLQGAKAEQRKWWLYNRFKYEDSKWNAGEALSQVIQLRGYAKADITITPYTDIYPTVKYASYLVQHRGVHGQPTTLACPLDNVNDTEIYLYSAPQIASCGDLSGQKVGFADFSMGVNLQYIKVGDASSSYENPNLNNLTLGSNKLLKSLDARNCTALGTGEQKSVDLSGCPAIEDVYFDGTKISGVSLPNGGVLKTLHLPSTIMNLTIMNQTNITDFTVPSYSNISTLRLENVSSAVDSAAIVNALAAGSRLRLIGFTWNMADYNAAKALYDKLDTMRGLDENGGNMDKAQVRGTIHVPSVTGAQLASMQERYPNITVLYDHITSYLYYYNFEGDTLLHTDTIVDGGNGTWDGQPAHDPTPANTFEFIGWGRATNSITADSTATQNVTADRNVYAAYKLTGQTYTVTFAKNSEDGGGTLQTVSNVIYGGSATYTGDTPTSSRGSAFVFDGWSPAPTNIQGNTTCYAVFRDMSSPIVKYLAKTMTEYESDTATTIGQYAFYSMTTLETATTSATTIEQYAFSSCSKLNTVDLTATSGQVSIAAYAFSGCSALTALFIRSTSGVATLASSNALPSNPFTSGFGAIYVPASLVAQYKSATNWSTYASRIHPIGDYPVTDFGSITDDWATIVSNINSGAFSYTVGATKSVTYGDGKLVMMELVNIGEEGTAKTAWMVKDFAETKCMHGSMVPYVQTEMCTYLENDVYNSLPAALKASTGIKSVDKTYWDASANTTQTAAMKVWLASGREVGFTGQYAQETSGVIYSSKFTSKNDRIKYNLTTNSKYFWMTRSAMSTSYFVGVNMAGNYYNINPTIGYGVVFGFCI